MNAEPAHGLVAPGSDGASAAATIGLRSSIAIRYSVLMRSKSRTRIVTLKAIAHELVAVVRRNATIDWDKKEQVRASLRRHIRRLLARYKYPPDKQESAVLLVMQQAELLAGELVA
jgi:type I restriction enzyme R subunit